MLGFTPRNSQIRRDGAYWAPPYPEALVLASTLEVLRPPSGGWVDASHLLVGNHVHLPVLAPAHRCLGSFDLCPSKLQLGFQPHKEGFYPSQSPTGTCAFCPPPKYAICILPIHMHLHPDFRSGGNVALSFLFHFQCVLHCLSALLCPPGPCRVLGGYYFST